MGRGGMDASSVVRRAGGSFAQQRSREGQRSRAWTLSTQPDRHGTLNGRSTEKSSYRTVEPSELRDRQVSTGVSQAPFAHSLAFVL